MDNLKKEGKLIHQQSIKNIREEYDNLLKNYSSKVINQIVDLVYEEMRGIPEYKIEYWINEYLMSDIKGLGNSQISKVQEILDTLLNSLILKSHQNKDSQFNLDVYTQNVNMMMQELSGEWILEISDSFVKQFRRKIENYYDVFSGISDYRFERALENIELELKSILVKTNRVFCSDYHEIFRLQFKQNVQKIGNCITGDNLEEVKVSQKDVDIESLKKILDYNNYELIDKNGKLCGPIDEKKQAENNLYHNPLQNILMRVYPK